MIYRQSQDCEAPVEFKKKSSDQHSFDAVCARILDPEGSGIRNIVFRIRMPILIRIQTRNFFYSDPDPKGVKIKEDNLYQQIFNKIFLNGIKTPLNISKH